MYFLHLPIGTRAGDAAEIDPIDEIFCKNREKSMLVGSIKSNMGHAELAAAMCQIAKVNCSLHKFFNAYRFITV